MYPRQSVASTGSSSTQRQTAKLTLSQLITAYTDAAAQPNPCPTHTQNISSSNLLSFQRKNIRGARARTHFLLPLSPPFAAKRLISLGLAVSAIARPRITGHSH